MKKNCLKYKKVRIAVLLLLTFGLFSLYGCSKKEVMVTKPENSSTEIETQSEVPGDSPEETVPDKGDQTAGEKPTVEQMDTETESGDNTVSSDQGEADTGKESELYHLIGLTKDELKQILKEEPAVVDEGGLEFENYGIRVWFDKESKVSQIYLLNEEIELNGVKTGDKITKFKEVFGDPIKDENGDAHFRYEDYYLSVSYDTKTLETFSVYLLKEDF
jgi:hypothetical protein